METVLENLRQATKCSMCGENREELKLLKCFHVFCENCLAEHAQLDQEGKLFRCPLCKTNTCLPRCGDFSSLETSSLHSHMRQVLLITEPNEATSTGLPTCSCKMRNLSNAYCCNCLRYFCVQCFNAHELLNEGHRILHLNELQEQDYKLLFRPPSFCTNPRHANDILKYYCRTCERCICEKCFLQDHQGVHDILDLETTADRQNTIYREKLRQLDAKEAAEQEKMKSIEDKVLEVRDNAEQLKTEVIKSAKELIIFIQENERHLLRQIDEEVKSLIDRQEEQECILKQIRTAREHVTRLTEYATAYQAVNSQDLIEQRLGELFAIKTELNDIDYNMEFIPSSELYQLQEFGLGSFRKLKPIDAAKSSVTLESDLHYMQALNTTSMSVCLKDSSGKLNDTFTSADIHVHIEPCKDVKNVKVSESSEGKCRVEFVPKVPGHFTVSVMVNSEHVSKSPIGLDVRPQELKVRGDFVLTGMSTALKQPHGIAVNKPNTKIAIAWKSNCVVICNTEGVFLNNITGQGNNQLKQPTGVAFLNDDDIVVADCDNHRIVIFNTTTGSVLRCFGRRGNGPGEFRSPHGVHVDERGRIIVREINNNRVQVFTGDGAYLFQLDKHVCGEGFLPFHAITHGNLLIVSDWNNETIHVVDEQGSPSMTRRCVIGGPGVNDGKLNGPRGLAVDTDDNLLVCDRNNHRIQKFTLDGRFVGKTCTGNISLPRYLTVLADGRILYTRWNNNKVMIVC